ncbi:hypothetical protein NO1_1275 [Candidatus Termititenax aidoneus]|uniref:Uncharacterized protein n=1 Tax=Termititenax aidoneus TaxID=2218524 RepID=A0A388TDQ7_TERA1|nr:hypothetical protein NO1_1275 [Candidatus Termititenax aidoneus]
MRKKTHGGARAGAGRKRITSEPQKQRQIRLDDDSWEKFKAFGGAQWLREMLNKN